jgi:acyl-CoA dehydrogenase
MSASSSSSCSLTYLRPEVVALKQTLDDFVDRECIPAEASYEAHLAQFHGADRFTEAAIPPVMKSLKKKAQDLGLWNLFIPPHLIQQIPDSVRSMYAPHIPLSIREYGIVCESMGRSFLAPEACNTSAPDTGNMEVLLEFGTPQQKQRYLIPLLAGTIRSTFLMTEPDVASSDPTNLQTTLTPTLATNNKNKNHHSYILQGRKWWSTGALHPHCRFAIVVARVVGPEATEEDSPQDYPHPTTGSAVDPHGNLFAIVIVPIPQSSKSSSSKIRIVRALECLGEDDAPSGHAEIVLDRVVVNAETDWIRGSGFRIAQARLGPGRIHHCMRAVGIGTNINRRKWEMKKKGLVSNRHRTDCVCVCVFFFPSLLSLFFQFF